MTTEEVDQVANDFLDGEIVDLASDWLGNTVRTAFYLALSSFHINE
jgi:protein JSN1